MRLKRRVNMYLEGACSGHTSPYGQPAVQSALVLTRSLLLGPPWSSGLGDLMNTYRLFFSVFVGGGITYECICLPSHRLLLEKLSFSPLNRECKEVPGDWSLSIAVGILSNQLVAWQVLSTSSHPTKKKPKQTSKQRKSPLKGHGEQVPCPP